MNLSQFINWPTLLVSFLVGIIFIIFKSGEQRSIIVYPNPDNIHKVQYKDSTDTCFKYDLNESDCNETAKNIPVQR